MKTNSKKSLTSRLLAVATAAAALCFLHGTTAKAADHQDAPNLSSDFGADLNDCFIFLDPNDNTQIVLGMTVHGFIIPGESLNMAVFDPTVLFRFLIENTGSARPNESIDITFSTRTSNSTPQIATIKLPNGKKFTAPTTVSTIAATPNPQVITTDPVSGVQFFAGMADDPFFFDIPAFDRFVASVHAGAPDVTQFNRGRDTFAGYNTLAIALRMPVSMLVGKKTPVIGMATATFRKPLFIGDDGKVRAFGPYYQVDRTATPAVNVALIPYGSKNAYNAADPEEDAAGKFAPLIVSTLQSLGTDDAHIAILAGIAVAHGDYLHLDTTVANSGPKGGTNAGAGFPNGRRLADDTITTLLTEINNGNPLSDNVPASDIPPQDAFPFFALPQQPRNAGVIDDNTRN